MRPIAVHSSNVQKLAYDFGAQRLSVWFNAAPHIEYVYDGVPTHVFLAVLQAKSVGSTFHQVIRSQPNTYPYEKIIYLEY